MELTAYDGTTIPGTQRDNNGKIDSIFGINISIDVKQVYVIDVENAIKTREILDKIATDLLMDGPWGSTHIGLLHDALLACLPQKCFRVGRLFGDYNISRGYRPGLSNLFDNLKHKYGKNLIYFQRYTWQLQPDYKTMGCNSSSVSPWSSRIYL